jgi:uncharacterized integral membrane protein
MADRETSRNENSKTRRPIPWRFIVGVVFVVLIVVFLAENTRKVSIRFVGPEVKAPLILALLIAAVLGSLATLLIQHRRADRS